MDVFTASLRSACSLRRGHFVNNLKGAKAPFYKVTEFYYLT
ncbi:putative exported protein [Yersinia pestis PY-13]|uniref:Gluconate 5-dehydrogenase n=1 Tax=Yersinia pseudotuberculosis serotype O:3 (strain YPIII) TaxID=502800 RepID=A0A0H3B4G6_YERPY|nr:putative exported protein [Yersinia pestis PY-06]EIR16977.1 putative exported protein [Yersinia pestis PY-07]EIR31484.1 putative exported protein [Yersinia pestis PY-10]EIR45792.1 putative exported protein [Yersinia pestis PY-13]EIR59626.1 putative exported protein [Yersinia pestis PY-16]EIR77005.1 putative exported protein [Yersinia pestis PY-32]EIR87842.1 putative exported protein [Yersinia pestis PY-36]EIS03841.1 putative exported protein [Yersinia pestis PY-46]EIS04453.1 putative exp